MQFVLNKIGFNFTTSAAKADAYSPFASHINDIENKRSRLFPDRRRIPGRKTKYIVTIVYLIHAYALMRLVHSKQIIKARAEQQVALQRKTTPFFQSVNDIQYTTLKHRWDLLAKEVLGEDFVKHQNYHNVVAWTPMNKNQTIWARGGNGRYQSSMFEYYGNRHAAGYETQNI